MTDNLPAVVQEARTAAADALVAGDPRAANEAYARELAALAGEAVEPGTVRVPSVRPATVAETDAFMDDLARLDPDGADGLRASWGGDLQANLGYADSVVPYLGGQQIDADVFDAELVRMAAAIGRGVHADKREGATLGPIMPVPGDMAVRFLATLAEDDPDGVAAWRREMGDTLTGLQTGLGAVRLVMGRYLPNSEHLMPDTAAFWRMAANFARRVVADMQFTTAPAARAETQRNSDMADDDDALDELRAKQSELMARGETKRANALYRQEQEILAARNGNEPIVGSRQRYA